MIIVTGGGGFIGSNLIKHLNRKGIDDIVVFDSLDGGNPEQFKNLLNIDFTGFYPSDSVLNYIENNYSSEEKNISHIIHLGACSDTTATDFNMVMGKNYEYTMDLYELAIELNIPMIYASSASVYGNGDNGFKEVRQCEHPLNIYAFSKYLSDRHILNDMHLHDTQIVGLRFFNVYGPQEHHKGAMASVISHFFKQAKNKGEVNPFEGSDEFLRDFIYVEDVCNMISFFMDNPQSKGVFNCGTGQARSFLDIANIVAKRYNVDVKPIPFPEHLKGKYQKFTKSDNTKILSTGFPNNFTSLEDGVNKYLDILESNDGYLQL